MVLVADQTREDINFGTNETTKDCVAKVKKKKKKRQSSILAMCLIFSH